jgi:hypothetical protein
MSTKREPRLEVRCNGRTARRSAWIGSKRWYVPTETPSGLPIDERHCPQFATEAEFRKWARRAG